MDLIKRLAADPALVAVADATARGGRVLAHGSIGSSSTMVAAALAMRARRTVVLVLAHIDDADDAEDELASFGVQAVKLPALEVLPGESSVSIELFAARLAAVRWAAQAPGPSGGTGVVALCPVQALMQAAPTPEAVGRLSMTVTRGGVLAPGDLVRWLDGAGYRRLDAVEEPGDFAVRGGIVDIFPPGLAGGGAVRIDFFGDEVDRIAEMDLDTMGSGAALDGIELVSASADAIAAAMGDGVSFLDLLGRSRPGAIALVHETIEVSEQARGYYERVRDSRGIFGPPAVMKLLQDRFAAFVEMNHFSAVKFGDEADVSLPVHALPTFDRDPAKAIEELVELSRGGRRVELFCPTDGDVDRARELLAEFGGADGPRVLIEPRYLHRGFIWDAGDGRSKRGDRTAAVSYQELVHRYDARRRTRRLRAGRAMDTFLEFDPGDLVVHRDHGIAKFVGLVLMPPRQVKVGGEVVLPGERTKKDGRRGKPEHGARLEEYLTLEFAGGTKLHVPATQIDRVQKYVGGRGRPALSKLGGERWQNQKAAVSESVRSLAAELLRVRAARESMPGVRYSADTAWQKEFEASFPFEETEDQLAALAEIKKDMQSDRPMDRLICGDVGYGKTEVAVRAAFKAVEFGKQVAVLVPTTVLAEQHERTFRGRFAGFPFRIESLSRFKTIKEVNDTLAALRKGQVDVVIGTHRLLSKDVKFADLGLVVVDEEQRFGVEHKERLLQLRMTADVLTLSATPIPRTLHMAMLGLRDISSLSTAPVDRRAVVTEVTPYNPMRLGQAIERELAREGQVFFVHNRVHNITAVADDVQRLAPDAKIVVGHGQMPDGELERVMLSFVRREADILVCTTIIESGIDIPTANTMIINDADRFGLADLHQLRGRVGRYKHRAYCYLLLPLSRAVTEKAKRRLSAIQEFSMLGAGFKIAMRDLEIRGAGDILGPEQSGHIAAVGYEMYCRLLDQAVHELRSDRPLLMQETTVELGVIGVIPKSYIPSDRRRLEAYRRLVTARSRQDLAAFERDLTDAYGAPPDAVTALIALADIRVAAADVEIRSIVVREKDVVFRLPARRGAELVEKLRCARGTVVALEPRKGEEAVEVYYRPPPEYLQPESLLAVLRRRLAAAPEAAVR